MAAKKKSDRMPEELFLEEATRAGRCIKTRISMRALGKPDTRFQARVEHLDKTHVSRLEQQLLPGDDGKKGDTFPVVVFCDPEKTRYVLADGFHRHDAYRNANRDDIPASQVTSDNPEQEALEFCVMCNRLAVKTRTKEDIRKAVAMMIENEKTRIWGNTTIARHVKCSIGLVASVRVELKTKNGVDIPDFCVSASGKTTPYFYAKPNGVPTVGRSRNSRCSVITVDGKKLIVDSKTDARSVAAAIKEKRNSVSRVCNPHLASKNDGFFISRGIKSEPLDQTGSSPDFFMARRMGSFIFSRCDIRNGGDLRTAIGHVRQAWLSTGRQYQMVVMCDTAVAPELITEIFSREDGVLFMTPDELVEALGGHAGGQAPDATDDPLVAMGIGEPAELHPVG